MTSKTKKILAYLGTIFLLGVPASTLLTSCNGNSNRVVAYLKNNGEKKYSDSVGYYYSYLEAYNGDPYRGYQFIYYIEDKTFSVDCIYISGSSTTYIDAYGSVFFEWGKMSEAIGFGILEYIVNSKTQNTADLDFQSFKLGDCPTIDGCKYRINSNNFTIYTEKQVAELCFARIANAVSWAQSLCKSIGSNISLW